MARGKARLNFTAEAFKKAVQIDPRIIEELAQFLTEQIVLNAQGFSQGTIDGSKTRLPDLSQSYISQRKGELHFRTIGGNKVPLQGRDPELNLSSKTRPGQRRSNLTYSGNLLDSLTFRTNKATGSITIFFKGTHPISRISNDQIYKYLIQKDENYKILDVNQTLLRRVKERIIRSITAKLRSLRR